MSIPPVPPDRADFNTFRQRRRASQQASAYDLTNQVFNAILPLIGRNKPMPMVYFTNRMGPKGKDIGHGITSRLAAALPAHYNAYGPNPTGILTFPKGAALATGTSPRRALPYDTQFRGRKGKSLFTDILLHELAHTQQSPRVMNLWGKGPDKNQRLQLEGGADAFAQLARAAVLKKLGLLNPHPFYAGYGQLGQQFINRYGRNYARSGQFQHPHPMIPDKPAFGIKFPP